MADTISPEMRSKNMSAIKSKNTKPEIYLRKKLFARGYRYRLYSNAVEGHPDIFLKKYNTAIFIHGCYWHRHQDCKYAYNPKSNCDFWNNKFQRNVARDLHVRRVLNSQGIRCLVVWECRLKKMLKDSEEEENVINQIGLFLHSSEEYMEI